MNKTDFDQKGKQCLGELDFGDIFEGCGGECYMKISPKDHSIWDGKTLSGCVNLNRGFVLSYLDTMKVVTISKVIISKI